MSKVAFTTLLNRPDSTLSPHFGLAKWVLIREESGSVTFEQNTGLNGRAVVDIMVKHGCSDAIFTQIGPGAFVHLQEAGIRGWIGPEGASVLQLVGSFARSELSPATAPMPKAPLQRHGAAHGTHESHCCAQHRH